MYVLGTGQAGLDSGVFKVAMIVVESRNEIAHATLLEPAPVRR
jgi:hypothetical protein